MLYRGISSIPAYDMTRHEYCRPKRLSSGREGREKHLDVDHFLFCTMQLQSLRKTNAQRSEWTSLPASDQARPNLKKKKKSFLASITRKLSNAPIGPGTERRRCSTWRSSREPRKHYARERGNQTSQLAEQRGGKKSTHAECSTLFLDEAQFFAMLWSRYSTNRNILVCNGRRTCISSRVHMTLELI